MAELSQEQKDRIAALYKAEVREAFSDTIKFVFYFALSVLAITFIGTYWAKSEEFIQVASFLNGIWGGSVFIGQAVDRRDRYGRKIQAVLK